MKNFKKTVVAIGVLLTVSGTTGNTMIAQAKEVANDVNTITFSHNAWENDTDKTEDSIKGIVFENKEFERKKAEEEKKRKEAEAKKKAAEEKAKKEAEEKKKKEEEEKKKKAEEEKKKKKEEEERKQKELEAEKAKSIVPTGEGVWFDTGFDTSFKSYMDYRCITVVGSAQYDMQHNWGAYTDENGLRKIGDDYCVALGTGITYGCGERFLVTLDTGNTFTCIVSDVKSDAHTDSTHTYRPMSDGRGNVVEFVVETESLPGCVRTSGSVGSLGAFNGRVVSVEKLQ